MNHRHLLSDEIDQLVDGEAGFGVVPLRAHVDECDTCRSRVAEARALVDVLEHLPRFTPSARFADRVMADVDVFEPWHVTALDAARRLTPRSRPARFLAAAGGFGAASLMTVVGLWLLTQLDILAFVAHLAVDRARAVVGTTGEALAAALLGDAGASVVRGVGLAGLAVVLGAMLAAIVGAAFGLRALATASIRRRE